MVISTPISTLKKLQQQRGGEGEREHLRILRSSQIHPATHPCQGSPIKPVFDTTDMLQGLKTLCLISRTHSKGGEETSESCLLTTTLMLCHTRMRTHTILEKVFHSLLYLSNLPLYMTRTILQL